jgi:acyl transferase domain-containing protein
MAFEWMLTAAQVGTSLLQARESTRAAQQQMEAAIERQGITAGRAAFAGPLERFQIQNVARAQSRSRRQELAQTIGAQRASFAASGVIGGRTQRLSLARSQAAFSREQALSDQQTRLQLLASQERQRAAMQNARLGMSDAGRVAAAQGRQASVNLASSLLDVASTNFDLFQNKP